MAQEGSEARVGDAAQVLEQGAVKAKVDPQHLGHGEDEMPVGHGGHPGIGDGPKDNS
jgi:hypothetical protein